MRGLSLRSGLAVIGLLGAWVIAPRVADAVPEEHDFSSVAPGSQVCIACHAPHKANSTKLLWNHVLSSSDFSWSDTTQTTGGTDLPANIKTWSGSSKMCLSCHDGTVAIGAIYVPNTTFYSNKVTGSAQVAAGGDLKGNHPVAVPYPYGGVKNTYNGITTGDLAMDSEWSVTPTNVKIFIDPTEAGPSNRGIECATCHDPHGTSYDDMLRDSISGSSLCTRCHLK